MPLGKLQCDVLQNGYDYRGNTTSVYESWIDEWNGTDSLRFDVKYIDSNGTEYLDHYYYDSVKGLSNKPGDEKLAGEADLVLFEDQEKEEKEEKENYDLIKSAEYKDGNFNFTLFTQEENHHLDVGGNEDGSKGFISRILIYRFLFSTVILCRVAE